MARTRVSTTVDEDLLVKARGLDPERNDAALLDAALGALLARHRSTEIDEAYAAAYGAQPLEEGDRWGDLASFHTAAVTPR